MKNSLFEGSYKISEKTINDAKGIYFKKVRDVSSILYSIIDLLLMLISILLLVRSGNYGSKARGIYIVGIIVWIIILCVIIFISLSERAKVPKYLKRHKDDSYDYQISDNFIEISYTDDEKNDSASGSYIPAVVPIDSKLKIFPQKDYYIVKSEETYFIITKDAVKNTDVFDDFFLEKIGGNFESEEMSENTSEDKEDKAEETTKKTADTKEAE